jgi:hypothetical protein
MNASLGILDILREEIKRLKNFTLIPANNWTKKKTSYHNLEFRLCRAIVHVQAYKMFGEHAIIAFIWPVQDKEQKIESVMKIRGWY